MAGGVFAAVSVQQVLRIAQVAGGVFAAVSVQQVLRIALNAVTRVSLPFTDR